MWAVSYMPSFQAVAVAAAMSSLSLRNIPCASQYCDTLCYHIDDPLWLEALHPAPMHWNVSHNLAIQNKLQFSSQTDQQQDELMARATL